MVSIKPSDTSVYFHWHAFPELPGAIRSVYISAKMFLPDELLDYFEVADFREELMGREIMNTRRYKYQVGWCIDNVTAYLASKNNLVKFIRAGA